jgi:hypothetical protein
MPADFWDRVAREVAAKIMVEKTAIGLALDQIYPVQHAANRYVSNAGMAQQFSGMQQVPLASMQNAATSESRF